MTSTDQPIPVSAAIISRDAELTIKATLDSLTDFAEVVVYDNGSNDRTVEIAQSFPNVRVHTGEFLGFGPTKNHAAGLASQDWIFSIDSDECVSDQLRASIAAADLTDDKVAYQILRINYLMGRPVRHSGWNNDWLLRLYNRNSTQVNDAAVHEKVQAPIGGQVKRLSGELSHSAVRDLGDFLVKINRYTELNRQQARRLQSPLLIALRSIWTFLRIYFLKLGFLDGWRGLVIAVCDANGTFFKYMKPYADHATAAESGTTRHAAHDSARNE